MIEVKNLTKRFGKKTVLDSVSMRFPEGKVSFVLGKSGVGKSVLLKQIVGLLKPDAGEIFVDGENIVSFGPAELHRLRKKCGMVFQFPALLDSLSVYDNVAFGVRSHKLAEAESQIREIVFERLRQVHLKESISEKFPADLSFGEQKRVAIARTLAVNPNYLLFDEPTTSMDPITTNALTSLIGELSKRLGITCLVVSHDLESAFKIADRMILLSDGKVAVDGAPSEMRESEHFLAREFVREMERYHD